MDLLTAEQMAKQLNMSVKTFYKRVRKYRVPFIDAGRRLFDPENVLRCLETTEGEPLAEALPKPVARRGLTLENEKYRKLLDL